MELPVGMGEMKKANTQNTILAIIRKYGELSKLDIKRMSKYSMSTVLSVIDELERCRYIRYSRTGKSSIGRKPTLYTLNAQAGYFIGVEFSAEEIHCVLLDFTLKPVNAHSDVIDLPEINAQSVIGLVCDQIRGIAAPLGAGWQKQIIGLGVGSPGYVDEQGKSLYYAYIRDWADIDLKTVLEKEFHIPVHVDNNINLLALAHKDVSGKDQNFLLLSIRTGIRFGCVLNNSIYRGTRNLSGEIGHTTVYPGSRQCRCGRKGCLESEISNYAVMDKITEGISYGRFTHIWEMAGQQTRNITISLFARSVLAGHRDSMELFDEICSYLGGMLAQSVNLFNPSLIYLRGPLTEVGSLLVDKVNEVIARHSYSASLEGFELRLSPFGVDAGAIGAAYYAMDREFQFVSIPDSVPGL